jgi:hypothetical protein
VPRFDKYEPRVGGFRAPLLAATVAGLAPTGDAGKIWAVGLDASGRVVKGASVSGIVGIICPVRPMVAGEMIDVMTSGEIAEFTLQAGTAGAAGTRYYGIAASGDFSTTATGTPIGWTVEASRLIVRVHRVVALVTT